MDLSKLLHGFVKVVLCISCPLPNKTKLMFGQDFKLVEASTLNKRMSQCLGSFVPKFGNV